MDAILNSLGGLLLSAIPTFVLLIVLHFYLKRMFFVPLDRVLEQRRQATEGARSAAQASLQQASGKAAEYEAAIRAARGEIYKEQEEARRQQRVEQATALEAARRESMELARQARVDLAAEVALARESLALQSEQLAGAIAASILKGTRN
jgi:F-type H+-transporting ATPase subunit b